MQTDQTQAAALHLQTVYVVHYPDSTLHSYEYTAQIPVHCRTSYIRMAFQLESISAELPRRGNLQYPLEGTPLDVVGLYSVD